MKSFSDLILSIKQKKFSRIIQDLNKTTVCRIDLSEKNSELEQRDVFSVTDLKGYIQSKINAENAKYGIGGYGEDRIIYKKSALFGKGKEARTIHLGTDIWCKSGTDIFCPYDAEVHSFNNNDNFKDYGPTIILKHITEDSVFYTLYGHLSISSLKNLRINKRINAGDKFAETGDESENGEWPPHLHFQIIRDMNGYFGDFPGVVNRSEKESFFEICPDPNLILGIE